jgi:hypothetical protein
MTEPEQMRISDDDRHRVAEILREAAGEGRLEIDELDERLEATYAARTYADLVPITVDLPAQAPSHQPAPLPHATPAAVGSAPRYNTSISVMGGVDRKGIWEVGPTHNAVALMAGITVDLREAVFTTPEVVVTANAFWAGIDVIVNEHTRVIVDGVGVMGSFDQVDKVPPQLTADSPTVRVRGVALMAGISVVRKGPRRERRRKRLHDPR